MKRLLIERDVPGASQLTRQDLCEISRTSNEAVSSLGVPYTWINSHVAGDRIYCIHEAEDAQTIREHARRGGFPANLVVEVVGEFDATTAHELDPETAGHASA